jgi:GTP-binding protein
MGSLVVRQARQAVEEADVLIFLMDGRAGLTPADEEIHDLLRRSGRPLFCAVNKIDTSKAEERVVDFYRLGTQQLYPLSSEHGRGIDELLEAILPLVGSNPEGETLDRPRIAVLGRPNTGKSTLVNTLLKEERLITCEVPGTTRDSIDTLVTYQGREYLFIDTAGIRRRGRIEGGVEYYSVNRAMRSLEQCNIALLLLDAREGATEQDTKIAGAIRDAGRGSLLVLNKIDLLQHDPQVRAERITEIKRRFPFLTYAPVLSLSGKSGEGIAVLFERLQRVMGEYSKRVTTGGLNRVFEKLVARYPHPLYRGREVKLLYMTQAAVKPPTFVIFMKRRIGIRPSYLRYLENGIREAFGFEGSPLRILLRESQ